MILVVRSELVPMFRQRLGTNAAGIFASSDSLLALGAILEQTPKIVALDQSFVATARGAALIARVKADPRLAGVDLRVLAEDQANLPVLLGESVDSGDDAMTSASRPLDQCGTRRAPRFKMQPDTVTMVNGERSRLVNLSVTGAQVLCPGRLQPMQSVRVVLLDGDREARFSASIAWSSCELGAVGTTYRAGLQFTNADERSLESYILRRAAGPEFSSATA